MPHMSYEDLLCKSGSSIPILKRYGDPWCQIIDNNDNDDEVYIQNGNCGKCFRALPILMMCNEHPEPGIAAPIYVQDDNMNIFVLNPLMAAILLLQEVGGNAVAEEFSERTADDNQLASVLNFNLQKMEFIPTNHTAFDILRYSIFIALSTGSINKQQQKDIKSVFPPQFEPFYV
jgi:hypothetical protein